MNHLTKLCSGDWKGGFLFINESVGEINKLQLKSGKIIWVQNVLKIVLYIYLLHYFDSDMW